MSNRNVVFAMRNAIEHLESRLCYSASIVADVNPTVDPGPYERSPMAALGGTSFFVASTPETGLELWKTDGAPGGASLVKDIWPGPSGSNSNSYNLTPVGDTLYFSADDGLHRPALWKTDGTDAGTVLVKDVRPPEWLGQGTLLTSFIAYHGDLLFTSYDGSGTGALWRSDGTEAGTRRLHAFKYGAESAKDDETQPVLVGDTVFFAAYDVDAPGEERELWKTDGTEAGTVRVKNINSAGSSNPTQLTPVGGRLFFSAKGDAGFGLWITDGTEEGTRQAHFLPKGIDRIHALGGVAIYRTSNDRVVWSSDGVGSPVQLGRYDGGAEAIVGDIYYFARGQSLWKTDGAAKGTALVRSLQASTGLNDFQTVGGLLLFRFNDYDGGIELWRSDGTADGTTQVHQWAMTNDSRSIATVGGSIVFQIKPQDAAPQLWRSDGTTDGTTYVAELSPRIDLVYPLIPLAADDVLYYQMNDADGRALWKSDLTPQGTSIAYRYFAGTASSNPAHLLATNDAVYFDADDGAHGRALWKSDGTEAGTTLIRDFSGGTLGFNNDGFAAIKGHVLFQASDGQSTGLRTWSTDGTAAGTFPLPGYIDLSDHFVREGFLYGKASSFAFVRTDGTVEGTTFVGAGFNVGSVTTLVQTRDAVYFTFSSFEGDALWKSDGTEAGTTRVMTLPGFVDEMFVIDESLFLPIFNAATRKQDLWTSDGSADGLKLVQSGFADPTGSSRGVYEATVSGDLLYFQSWAPETGYAVWRSDGTPAGTRPVRPIGAETGFVRRPTNFTDANGTLYFLADGGLWTSDGSDAGTVRVTTVLGGGNLKYVGGAFYFTAGQRESGQELWTSDGTAAGTKLAVDVWPGTRWGASFNQHAPYAARGDTLYFPANDGRHGIELWKYTPDAPPPAAQVLGRQLFYNNSAFDGGDRSAEARDENAIATDKQPLVDGQTPNFSNVSSYAKGINGLIVDVKLASGVLNPQVDFEFQIGDGVGWTEAPQPLEIIRRAGMGEDGSDRFHITWVDGSIVNRWLRVHVFVTADGATPIHDMFQFGSLVGETGDGALAVGAGDLVKTRNALGAKEAAAENRFDFNRDGHVNAADLVLARNNVGHALPRPPLLSEAGSLLARLGGVISKNENWRIIGSRRDEDSPIV